MHKTLKMTPAMAAGVSDRLWSVEDIALLVAADEPAPAKRGPYKKRATRGGLRRIDAARLLAREGQDLDALLNATRHLLKD
jgi:hypothetical protein